MKERDTVLYEKLQSILAALPQEAIYRSVYDPGGKLLAAGLEPLRQQLLDDFGKVDFSGKTVIDLGCNFGLFSFLAAERGARTIVGIDSLAEAVQGASLLASMKNMANVRFEEFDFEEPDRDIGQFDLVMLVDFFGRANIGKCKVKPIIEFMASIAEREMLFAIRPINRIEKDLHMSLDVFGHIYPKDYIEKNTFLLLRYIEDLLSPGWDLKSVSPWDGGYRKHKLLFLCTRK